jgi:hypothetical protein
VAPSLRARYKSSRLWGTIWMSLDADIEDRLATKELAAPSDPALT